MSGPVSFQVGKRPNSVVVLCWVVCPPLLFVQKHGLDGVGEVQVLLTEQVVKKNVSNWAQTFVR